MSDMHDPYEDQLAAARYRAERDQARQECERLQRKVECLGDDIENLTECFLEIAIVTEGEPPYNLYSLYEAVFRRHPSDEYAIEDDEVEELVDALLDICNAPGHEHIQRKQPR